ncbi:MAG: hypothetical protein ABIK65_12660 [Candidatus Eisenbacteria bacterium]
MLISRRSSAVPLLILVPVLFWFACGGTEPSASDDPSGALLSYSECKYGVEPPPKVLEEDSSTDSVEWSYMDGTLSLTHVNSGGNCCPDSLTAEVEVSGDTIYVREGEVLTEGGCRCLCLYDRVYEIKNLSAKAYSVQFEELYLTEGESPLAFDADLAASPAGSHSVTRENYPWGVVVIE